MSIPSNCNKQRATIHFDINGTVMFGDDSSGRTVEQSLNYFLSKELYHTWDTKSPPMSYYDYVNNHRYPGIPSLQKTKRNLLLNRFITHLKEASIPIARDAQKVYTLIQKKLKNGQFFQSFRNALYLFDNDENSIVFRTFGSDLDSVEEIIKKWHPKARPIKAEFIETDESEDLSLQIYDNDAQIISTLSDPKKILATFDAYPYWLVQDCHDYWHRNGHDEKGMYGKPFYYNPTSERTYLFFDDNAKDVLRAERTIINPIQVTDAGSTSVNINETEGRVIEASFMSAVLDKDYYTDIIQTGHCYGFG